MGKRASLVVIFAAGVCAMAPLASCLDATEIVLELSTDVSCATVQGTDVHIRIGSPKNIDGNPPTRIESTACTPGDATASARNDLGNVVVVPSGGFDDAVAISVALSNDSATPTSACFPEGPNAPPSCIYAHRQISFLPHNRVSLPIVLSSVCAGVSCVAPETCDPTTGKCGNGKIDPNDCGTNCTTGEDAGTPDIIVAIDSPAFDVTVFDSPVVDAPSDAGCGNLTLCSNKCVNLMTDVNNCGACGVDCSGTPQSCNNGTCTLNATAAGTCLAVNGGTVFVATAAGVFTYPSNGGTGTLYNNASDDIVAMASMPSHVAWFGTNLNTAYVWDQVPKKPYNESNSTAFMALNGVGFAWFDSKQNQIIYQSTTQTTPTPYNPIVVTTGNAVPIAMGSKYVYASFPASNELLWTDGTTYGTVTNVTPGPIIVDDPTKLAPNVYDYEKGVVWQRDSQLANPKQYATSASVITSMVWDGTKVLANATTNISYAQNGTFFKIVAATPAPKCIAIDSNAVYWLDATAGLYKHARP